MERIEWPYINLTKDIQKLFYWPSVSLVVDKLQLLRKELTLTLHKRSYSSEWSHYYAQVHYIIDLSLTATFDFISLVNIQLDCSEAGQFWTEVSRNMPLLFAASFSMFSFWSWLPFWEDIAAWKHPVLTVCQCGLYKLTKGNWPTSEILNWSELKNAVSSSWQSVEDLHITHIHTIKNAARSDCEGHGRAEVTCLYALQLHRSGSWGRIKADMRKHCRLWCKQHSSLFRSIHGYTCEGVIDH